MGRFVERFDGAYVTAEDVNVTVDDLRAVSRSTAHVCGLSRAEGGGGDPGPYTAYGCFLGLRATLGVATGDDSLEGRTVALQGAGSVGLGLAPAARRGRRHPRRGGRERGERRARGVRARTHGPSRPDEIYDVDCDVFAPCALGGRAERRDDPAPPLRRGRGRGQQPAPGRAPALRAAPGARDPLRPRLRDQRGRHRQRLVRAPARRLRRGRRARARAADPGGAAARSSPPRAERGRDAAGGRAAGRGGRARSAMRK